MMRNKWGVLGLVTIAFLLVPGCRMSEADFDEMMKAPARPADLDRLDMFTGTWEGTAEMKIMGLERQRTGKFVETYTWDADKWALTSESEGSMEGNKMAGVGLWNYNPSRKRYEYYMTDNYGMVMTGTAKYDAESKTWKMKGQSHERIHNRKSRGNGTLRFVDANTMEYHWTEWDALHLIKFMEMNGTSRRR